MRRSICWASWLLVVAVPLAGAAEGKRGGKAKYEPTQEDIEALVKAGQVVGKVGRVDISDKGFTLIYEYQNLTPKSKRSLSNPQQRLMNQYNQIMRTRNPFLREARLQQFLVNLELQPMKTANQLFRVKQDRKDFDLQAIEDVKVRLMKLPVEYDEKGNVKKYTAAEKRKLKGKGKDAKLPGYEGNWENLSDGQTVKVYFKAAKKKPARDKKKKDDEEAKQDEGGPEKPQVRMIVVLQEPTKNDKPERRRKGDR
jgi:hypothetical protein